MLDRQLIRRDPEFVRAQAARKGVAAPVDEFLRIDESWRTTKTRLDEANAESNRISKTIGQLMGQGKREEAEAAKAQTAALKNEVKELEAKERELEEALREVELQFPNLPHASVPEGTTPEDNPVVRTWGEPAAQTRPHFEIGEELGFLDPDRGVKLSGSGFVVYRGGGARLLRALVNWMADFQTLERGYEEVYPPYLVNAESMVGTGNLPKFAEELYKTQDDLYLVPTAEVPVTNLYRDEILEPWQVPMKLAAYTACFRREAGAAGRMTRGIQRMHQFDKLELVRLEKPDQSYAALEELVRDAEAVLQALDLPYRVIELCTGDLGDKGCKCYDLEVWSPGEQRWLEVSSCTNFEAFQARRANLRYRPEPGAKPEYVHTLNGSGLAVPRVLVAILETGYAEGEVRVPEVLVPYVKAPVLTGPA